MKRTNLLSFILLLAISLCCFSTAIFAGDGKSDSKPGGDTHPWDEYDSNPNDSANGLITYYASVNDPNSNESLYSLSALSFSLSYQFSAWIYSQEKLYQQAKQEKSVKTIIIDRGSYRTNKLMK